MDWKDTYGFYLYNSRKSFGTSPNFYNRKQAPLEGFSSLYGIDQDTASAIIEEGTTKGFKGIVWDKWLKIDIDSYGDAARAAKGRLIEMGLSFVEYDSGGKGHHFYVERLALPSHLLPQKDKMWVKSNFPEADTSIYTHLHLFRLPGTKHEETGKYKKVLDAVKGNVLVLPKLEVTNVISQTTLDSGNIDSIFNCYRVMRDTVPVSAGERHAALVRLAYALRDDAKANREACQWWMEEVNKLYDEPKETEEIRKIVQSIYNG